MAHQQYDAEFVEYIVREVIRRLRSGENRDAVAATSQQAGRELPITDRLVTLATVQGKLDGVGKVMVARRAIVTPAVRDELSRRQIELKRER